MKSKRLLYIDVLNCLAIFGVLVQHTAQIAHQGDPNLRVTIIGNILQSIFIPAVGIFLMNSGAMLLDYRNRQSTETFFKKRVSRVLIPFLLWSIFYYWYGHNYYAFPGVFHHNIFTLHNFIQSFIDNKINSLFWFFYVIIQLYIATPVLSVLTKKHHNLIAYIVYINLIIVGVFPYLFGLKHFDLTSGNLSVPILVSSWLGYFAMGYLIKVNYFSNKIENIFIAFGVVTFIANIINDILKMQNVLFNNISTMFYTFALYFIVKRVCEYISDHQRFDFLHQWFSVLSSASLGIYILHPMFLQLLDWLAFHATPKYWNHYYQVLQNPIHIYLWPFVLYAVLTILVIMVKKIKFIKYILP